MVVGSFVLEIYELLFEFFVVVVVVVVVAPISRGVLGRATVSGDR